MGQTERTQIMFCKVVDLQLLIIFMKQHGVNFGSEENLKSVKYFFHDAAHVIQQHYYTLPIPLSKLAIKQKKTIALLMVNGGAYFPLIDYSDYSIQFYP